MAPCSSPGQTAAVTPRAGGFRNPGAGCSRKKLNRSGSLSPAARIAGYAGFQAIVRHDETAPLPQVIFEELARACELRGNSAEAKELRRFAAELT